ncbi:Asp-tRNA(Asn)/Glu-tRNA(Gln) amidotransferase subunit GatB [Microgenomates group bacterium]|nr:Asp-tRNA(Asn)/Glu-tRNA(Gln) amidotransferase subunit GatB [Microgenomates group bacterium]
MSPKTSPYRLICGLEIHVELATASKMFCSCKNDPFFAPDPNIYTCDYCLGRETKAPSPNKKAIEYTIKFGLFTSSKINQHSYFERKHYVYPDVPKGYQISQCTRHFAFDGVVATSEGPVRLAEAHLEEDVAKLIHRPVRGQEVTLIDFNRSGVPLIEIVSQPDLHSSAQAVEYAKNIQAITRYLGIAHADMEKGQMRFDANISLQTKEQQKTHKLPDYKVEVKNINSFKSLGLAIDFEIKRQTKLLESGQVVPQETRGFDMDTNTTFFQRSKGTFVDFKALICPDMSKIELSDELLAQWRSELPPQREETLDRWQQQYQVEPRFSQLLLRDPATVAWAEELFAQSLKKKLHTNKLANFLVNGKLQSQVGDGVGETLAEFISLERTADFDEAQIATIIDSVLAAHPDARERYRSGQKQVLGFFVGEAMKAIAKKVDVQRVKQLIEDRL